jgi:hypothetical protein
VLALGLTGAGEAGSFPLGRPGTDFAFSAISRGGTWMMYQNEPQERRARIRRVPDWRLARRPYEVAYLMKLGGLTNAAALALIAKHGGDTYEINAELFSRRSSNS